MLNSGALSLTPSAGGSHEGNSGSSHFPGSNYGFTSGGVYYPGDTDKNEINRFSFSSDANASDWGDITYTRKDVCGQSSSTYGYTSGGYSGSAGGWYRNVIDKFSFTSFNSTADVGDLTAVRGMCGGASSTTHGYTLGGEGSGTSLDKFSFSSGGNASSIGSMSSSISGGNGGNSSSDNGYLMHSTRAEKVSFSSDGNSVDVGSLSDSRSGASGQSSTTYAFTAGGSGYSNVIDRMSFSSEGTASDVGDLTVSRNYSSGQSSTNYGYCSGGNNGSTLNIIDKFSFTSDGNATNVGDLAINVRNLAGHQY